MSQDSMPHRLAGVAGAARLSEEIYDHALIIRMLILRELRNKYRNNPLGMMLEFMQPVVVSTAHYLYFSLTGRDVPDKVYLVFVVGGFSIWFCFVQAYMGTMAAGIRGGSFTNIPGVTIMHAQLAKTIWAFLLFFAFAYVISIPAMLLGAQIRPPDPVLTAICYGLAAGSGFGFGMVTNAIAVVLPPLAPFLKLFRWALFITSGIYNSLSTIGRLEAPYVWYNPLIHMAEYMRHAFDPGYPVFFASLTYPTVVLAGLLFFGLASQRALARRGRGMNGVYA